jgi:S1-C subfamily serine protease
VRLWPGPAAWANSLCDKLSANMSHKQWRDWVSPDIAYISVCSGLPIAADVDKSSHASLGARLTTDPHGAKIVELITGGPAATAGLPVGAVITKADDHTIDSVEALVTIVKSKAPGDKMTLTYTDLSGASRTIEVVLGSPRTS